MTRKFKIIFSEDAELDFELIFDFLNESYLSFDEDIETSLNQAGIKTQSIRKATNKLATHPFRVTLHDDGTQKLRHITIGRALYWFDILEDERLVRILAVFYGGQDHYTKILTRLLSKS